MRDLTIDLEVQEFTQVMDELVTIVERHVKLKKTCLSLLTFVYVRGTDPPEFIPAIRKIPELRRAVLEIFEAMKDEVAE